MNIPTCYEEQAMFSIIIPVLDPFDLLVSSGAIQSSLGKAFALKGEYELIIVNNNPVGSCPQLTKYLRLLRTSYPEIVKLVEPDVNLGTARGFNAGLRFASANSEYLVFMSTDADIVDTLMLSKIKHIMDSQPSIGIAHPTSVFEDLESFNFSSKYGIKAFHRMILHKRPPAFTDIPNSELQQILEVVSLRKGIKAPLPGTPLTFAIYRQEMIKRIGSFDEGVEYGCYETYDLAYRALLSGYNVALLNGIFVNHRRFYIRNLVVGETPESKTLPHSEALKQSRPWWNKKWGRPYAELYAMWRWGHILYTLLLPYYWCRRVGTFVKRTIARRRGRP